MKKLSKIVLIIGIVVLALGFFFSLCKSDNDRLYELDTDSMSMLEAAKTTMINEKENVVVPADTVPVDASFKNEGSIASLPDQIVTIDNKDYYLIDYDTFVTAGGQFKADKFGTTLETKTGDDGTVYNYGTVLLHSLVWDNMTLIQKITCIVNPVINISMILGGILIVLALLFKFIGNAQASGKSFGEFFSYCIAKYNKVALWFIMIVLILAALFAIIVAIYTFINNPAMESCVISRCRDSVIALLDGKSTVSGLILLGAAIGAILLAMLLKKVIGKDELARKAMKFISDNAIICGIVLLAVFVRLNKDSFFSESNLRNLLSNTAVRFIIAAGVSGCLITKGTDLSAGRMTGFAACLCAIFLQKAGDYSNKFYPSLGNLPIIPVLLAVVALCALLGAINGSVISILKVPPFIATLGMQTLVYGICMVYTGSEPIGTLQPAYTALAQGYFGNRIFSYIAIIALCVGLLMWFLYNKTRYGKYMYAIGGNEVAAEVAGINTVKSKIKIYALAACMYALTGFIMASKSGGASVNTASGYELEAIAGCTIGGVSVNGGVGKISGILVGVLVFELLKIALQWLGIPSEYTYIAQGLVIIVAVALDLRKYLAKK